MQTTNGAGLIFEAIPKIMGEVDPIAKVRRNQSQGYQFRGIDDVYAALQLILSKYGVFTVPEVLDESRVERANKSGGTLTFVSLKIRYRFYAIDGSSVDAVVIGEGMDSGDKATNKAMSVAHKYALLQVFAIPTEEAKDPEEDSPEPLPVQEKQHPGPEKSPQKPTFRVITEAQRKRLWAISSSAGIAEEEGRLIIQKYGYDSSAKITNEHYDKIIGDIQKLGLEKKQTGGING